MSETAGTKNAAVFMLLGSVITLAVLGIGWAVWRETLSGEGASPGSQGVAGTEAGPAEGGASAAGLPSDLKTALTTSVESETASAEALAADAARKAAAGTPTTETADPATLTGAEEEAAETEAKAANEEEAARELAYMEERFEERKRQLMEIIDNYLDLPVDERPGYLQQAFEDLRRVVEEDRAAQGLPARPRNPGTAMRGFFKLLGTSASEEEKTKLRTFIGDVMQMQMARVQAQIEEQMGANKPKSDLKPYHP